MQQPSYEPAASIPYSAHEAGRLLFSANRFSQGRTDGVNHMLDYALSHVDWKPEEIVVADVVAAVRKRVITFVGNSAIHAHIAADEATEMLEQQAQKLKLHADTRADAWSALQQCARHAVTMDMHYLSTPVGRPRYGGKHSHSSSDYHDPWLSHSCQYGVLGAPTGHPLFDKMFADMRPYLTGGKEWQLRLLPCLEQATFQCVVLLHNTHHPAQLIHLPD